MPTPPKDAGDARPQGPAPPPFASQNSPAKASMRRARSLSDSTEPPTPVKTPSPPTAFSSAKASSTARRAIAGRANFTRLRRRRRSHCSKLIECRFLRAFALSRLAGVKSGEDECEAGKAVVLYSEALRGLKRVATALVPHKNEAKAAELLS